MKLYSTVLTGGEILIRKTIRILIAILGVAVGTTFYINLAKIFPAVSFGMGNIFLPGLIAGLILEIGRASCRERFRSRWSPYH